MSARVTTRSRRPTRDRVPLPQLGADQAADECIDLAREAREVADLIDNLQVRLSQAGAFGEIRRYALRRKIEIPPLDLMGTARSLRCHGGYLCLLAGSLRKPAMSPLQLVEEAEPVAS